MNTNLERKALLTMHPRPSKLRLALAMFLPVYLLITALLYVLIPLTEGWEIWHRTLLIAPLMISSIIFLIGPTIQKHLSWFIMRLPKQ